MFSLDGLKKSEVHPILGPRTILELSCRSSKYEKCHPGPLSAISVYVRDTFEIVLGPM